MASISDVRLDIFHNAGSALVQVSYKLSATLHDVQHEQSYRELVQLVGDDTGPGEDGQSELIPGGTVWDGVVTFASSQVAFTQIHEITVPSSLLNEDTGTGFFVTDEIRARVTMIPLPMASPSRDSNLVRRNRLTPGIEPVIVQPSR